MIKKQHPAKPIIFVPKTLAKGLEGLLGKAVSSIEFVQNYVQIRFDGPCLTAYTLPKVTNHGRDYCFGDDNYRDVLCATIGSKISGTSVDKDGVSISCDNGIGVNVSLQEADYIGPEALQFIDDHGNIWVA